MPVVSEGRFDIQWTHNPDHRGGLKAANIGDWWTRRQNGTRSVNFEKWNLCTILIFIRTPRMSQSERSR